MAPNPLSRVGVEVGVDGPSAMHGDWGLPVGHRVEGRTDLQAQEVGGGTGYTKLQLNSA